jgi:hypothetical protein
MELQNVKNIYETYDYSEAEMYISHGWKLLFIGQYTDNSGEYARTSYSLGWKGEEKAWHYVQHQTLK